MWSNQRFSIENCAIDCLGVNIVLLLLLYDEVDFNVLRCLLAHDSWVLEVQLFPVFFDLVKQLSNFVFLRLPSEDQSVLIELHFLFLIGDVTYTLEASFIYFHFEVDCESERRALTESAFYLNAASKLFYDVFWDHKAQTDAVSIQCLTWF